MKAFISMVFVIYNILCDFVLAKIELMIIFGHLRQVIRVIKTEAIINNIDFGRFVRNKPSIIVRICKLILDYFSILYVLVNFESVSSVWLTVRFLNFLEPTLFELIELIYFVTNRTYPNSIAHRFIRYLLIRLFR